MESPIVITGMGMISPLGCGVKTASKRLFSSQSGITLNERVDVQDFPVKIAGLVPSIEADTLGGFDPSAIADTKELKKLELFTQYAFGAAKEALTQANWFPSLDSDKANTATIIATGIGGFPTITRAQKLIDTRGVKRLSPFTAPAFLANMAAGNISIRYGFRGPLGCPVTACSASLQAIGDGIRLIRSGEANVALVGGAEACIDPLALGSFHALKALSTRNDEPSNVSRPFDKDRTGFVMGEGAGALVIESLAHAQKRGANPIAVVSGYGTSADAYHMTAGHPNGEGAALAIRAALKAANLQPGDLDYINAHATSTQVGDDAEIAALRNVFGVFLPHTPISSTKSATGHLLGAAGAIATIFSVEAMNSGILPPTLNLDSPDEDKSDLDFVPKQAREKNIEHALINAFGFGGVNASLVLSKVN